MLLLLLLLTAEISTSEDASDFPTADLLSPKTDADVDDDTDGNIRWWLRCPTWLPLPDDSDEEHDGEDRGHATTENRGLSESPTFRGRSNSSASEPDRPLPGDLLEVRGGSGGLTGSLILATTFGDPRFKSGSLEPSGCFLCKLSLSTSSLPAAAVVVVVVVVAAAAAVVDAAMGS